MRKSLILFFLFFNFPMQVLHSQTIQALREREAYFHLAEVLQQKYKKENLIKQIIFEYSFVKIELSNFLKTEKKTWLSVRISQEFSILEVACVDKVEEKEILKFVHNFNKTYRETANSEWLKQIDTAETQEYLVQADEIAIVGSRCGQSYSPSYYSKIYIDEAKIYLEQVDYKNAKSLEKENYVMRSLFFEIEYLKDANREMPPNILYQHEYAYKSIKIRFNDYSSPNHQDCGKAIIETIKDLIQKKHRP